MAVRKIGKKRTTKKKQSKTEPTTLSLPTEKKVTEPNFFLYASLFYGRAGVGKTTMLSSFPNALMFSCERVSKGIECHDFNWEDGGVHSWDIFLAGVELLEQTDQFETICIDTIDAAYAHCMDYVCKNKGIEHPQDEGYGKGWAAVKEEFASTLDRIWATGRGVVFSSHAKEVTITSHSGEEYTRIQPTMSGQAYSYIKAKSDFVFYCEYVKDRHGRSRRVIFTTGDEIVDAKHAGDLPQYLPLDKSRGVEVVVDAFCGEDVGIPIDDIRPSKETSKSGETVLTKQRLEAARKNSKKKKLSRKRG